MTNNDEVTTYRFAFIDQFGRVYHIQETTAPYERDDMILSDTAQIGQRYVKSDSGGEFVAGLPTIEELVPLFEQDAESFITETVQAQPGKYTSIYTVASYVGYENSRQEFALSMCEWRDSVWNALDGIYEQISNGQRPIPASFDDIKPELPMYTN